jgi:hypothetical protein
MNTRLAPKSIALKRNLVMLYQRGGPFASFDPLFDFSKRTFDPLSLKCPSAAEHLCVGERRT